MFGYRSATGREFQTEGTATENKPPAAVGAANLQRGINRKCIWLSYMYQISLSAEQILYSSQDDPRGNGLTTFGCGVINT